MLKKITKPYLIIAIVIGLGVVSIAALYPNTSTPIAKATISVDHKTNTQKLLGSAPQSSAEKPNTNTATTTTQRTNTPSAPTAKSKPVANTAQPTTSKPTSAKTAPPVTTTAPTTSSTSVTAPVFTISSNPKPIAPNNYLTYFDVPYLLTVNGITMSDVRLGPCTIAGPDGAFAKKTCAIEVYQNGNGNLHISIDAGAPDGSYTVTLPTRYDGVTKSTGFGFLVVNGTIQR